MCVWKIDGKVVAEDGIIDEGVNVVLDVDFSKLPPCHVLWPESEDSCPWVLTYRDKGPKGMAPGGGWPTAVALYFPTKEAANDFLDANRHKFGRQPKVDLLPLKQPKEIE